MTVLQYRYIAILAAAVAAGCDRYVNIKDDLLAQSTRGVALIREFALQRQAMVEDVYESRRARLDQAFDNDARARFPADAQWIVDARRAYAAGIDAIHAQRTASAAAHQAALENLAAIESAIEQLRLLHQLERRMNLPGSAR